jgi:hypothetical protein
MKRRPGKPGDLPLVSFVSLIDQPPTFKTIVSVATPDSPPPFFTLKYTVFGPFPDDRIKEGAGEYVFQDAPVKLGDSLAMYCVGVFAQVLFSVTSRLAVVSAPLLMAKLVILGAGSSNRIMSLTAADSPPSFFTLKYTVFMPFPVESVNDGAVEYARQIAPVKPGDSLAM